MQEQTRSETCSGATLRCPEMWSSQTRARYSRSPGPIRSYLIPDAMKTCFTPGISRRRSSRRSCSLWLRSSTGQSMQRRSGQVPASSHRSQWIPYMFAVGPPTSWTTPVNSGIAAIRSTSRTIESMLRLWMILPWWWVRAQNEQEPKHPRWLTTENLTGSRAGTGSV